MENGPSNMDHLPVYIYDNYIYIILCTHTHLILSAYYILHTNNNSTVIIIINCYITTGYHRLKVLDSPEFSMFVFPLPRATSSSSNLKTRFSCPGRFVLGPRVRGLATLATLLFFLSLGTNPVAASSKPKRQLKTRNDNTIPNFLCCLWHITTNFLYYYMYLGENITLFEDPFMILMILWIFRIDAYATNTTG